VTSFIQRKPFATPRTASGGWALPKSTSLSARAFEQVDLPGEVLEFDLRLLQDSGHHSPKADGHGQLDDFSRPKMLLQRFQSRMGVSRLSMLAICYLLSPTALASRRASSFGER
jgi:hypothetical protein